MSSSSGWASASAAARGSSAESAIPAGARVCWIASRAAATAPGSVPGRAGSASASVGGSTATVGSGGGAGVTGDWVGGGWAPGSTMLSTFQSDPTTSMAACRTISALPPPSNDSRAPALLKPRVRVVPSTATTWACWVRWIQVSRRRALTASTMSGHRRRTSTSERPPAGAGWRRRRLGRRLGLGLGSGAVARRRLGGRLRGRLGRRRGGGFGLGGRDRRRRREPVRATYRSTVPPMATRRSRRSSRAITPSEPWSAPGSSTRAQISSSSSRGAVAPRISVRPVATRSAARLSSAAPNRAAWATSRSPASSATSMRPVAGASGTAVMMTRSRSRRSRSSANRRGSCPVSMTRSATANTDAPSPAANASITSSSSASGV